MIVARFYTKARKFPTVIGKTHDGSTIIGGPYKMSQVVAAAVMLPVLYLTMPLWAVKGLIVNITIGAFLFGIVVWAAGQVPSGARNPLVLASAATNALVAPRHGTIGGRKVRLPRKMAIAARGSAYIDGRPTRAETTSDEQAPSLETSPLDEPSHDESLTDEIFSEPPSPAAKPDPVPAPTVPAPPSPRPKPRSTPPPGPRTAVDALLAYREPARS